MTDITKIAADCATRIMDRMEMCRGSAILKGDIEREVEMALRQVPSNGFSGLQGETVEVFSGLQEPEHAQIDLGALLTERAMKALNEDLHKADSWVFAASQRELLCSDPALNAVAPAIVLEDEDGTHMFASAIDFEAYRIEKHNAGPKG
jgi:hypothetical protein